MSKTTYYPSTSYQPKNKYKFNPSQIKHNVNKVDYRYGRISKQQLIESETTLKNGGIPKIYHNPTIDILSNKWKYNTI